MTVRELIERLKVMPLDADVAHLWDGEPRTNIEHVWLSRAGDVVTADNGMVVYSTEARPEDAPTADEGPYWYTPRAKR
jgi:hypothetical protein